jgi:hypothetical protein
VSKKNIQFFIANSNKELCVNLLKSIEKTANVTLKPHSNPAQPSRMQDIKGFSKN